jgi:hypothetical protein
MSVEEVAEFAEDYSSQLRSMKRPAKEEINALTMVASDYVESPLFAHAVVQVLERAVNEVILTFSLMELHAILCNVQLARAFSCLLVSKHDEGQHWHPYACAQARMHAHARTRVRQHGYSAQQVTRT